MIFLTILMINSISASFSEWIEIPQSAVSFSDERILKKSDINSLYIYPTSSTTAHTPILPKPSTSQAKSQSKSNKSNNRNNNDKNNKNLRGKNNLPQNTIQIKTNRTDDPNKKSNKKSNERIDKLNNFKFDDNDNFDDSHLEDEEVQEDMEEEQYSYASFVPYLSTIQSTLMRNAHHNKKSKLNVLKNLQDQLLYEIQNRITSIWKPKGTTKEARHFQDNNNVEFPSNEAALMTIGFLTFAVFLIKLVLKLVQAINNKINMQDQSSALFGRKRRDVIDQEAIQILNYIDQYSFQ